MDSALTTNITHHCRTQLKLSTFSYTWSIANFWEIQKFVSGLHSDEIKNLFKLWVSFQEDKLKFYAVVNKKKVTNDKAKMRLFYSVFSLNNIETKIVSKCVIDLFNYKKKKLLCTLFISDLKKNSEKYLTKGVFTICFKFYKLDNLFNSSAICYSYKQKRSVEEDMPSFVPNKKLDSLVTFVINKEHLQASKTLLCSKSKVFEAMFNCGLKESADNKVEITDIKYNILQQLLSFLQIGYLPKLRTEEAYELFIAAEKYDIKDLKLICEQHLITNTTKENVVEHLKIAHLNNGTILKKYALDLIKLYLKDIADTPNFKTLIQEHYELLIQIENIQLPITNAKYSTMEEYF